MRDEQWNQIKSVIRGENDTVPFGVIVDSPWMPGYCGIGTMDFFITFYTPYLRPSTAA